jgi:hypothetical protein
MEVKEELKENVYITGWARVTGWFRIVTLWQF